MPRVFSLILPLLLLGSLVLGPWGPVGERKKNEGGSRRKTDWRAQADVEKPGGVRPRHRSLREGRKVEPLLEVIDPRLLAALEAAERGQLQAYLEGLSGEEVPRLWCWGEDTRPEKVAAFAAVEEAVRRERAGVTLSATQFLGNGRWRETAVDGRDSSTQGDPVVVTWSLVPDGTPLPGQAGGATEGSDLRAWMTSLYGETPGGTLTEQPWFVLFEEAAALISDTSGVVLRYEPNDDGASVMGRPPGVLGLRGDIRIGARFLDGNSGLLGISLGPDDGDMVLDSGDGTFDLTGGNSLRLVNTLTHELGHCLGLAHVCPVDGTKLMEPNLSTAFRGPQFDEFQSLQRLYGDHLERRGVNRDNDTIARATALVLEPGEEQSWPRLSIDDNDDVDCFALDVLAGQRIGVVLIPGEGEYAEGGEGPGGCAPGTLFDSRAVQDLQVEIWDREGETILASADREGPGHREEIDSFEFPRSGRYFLKVGGGRSNAAQLYEMRLRLDERLPGPRLVVGEAEVVEESGVVKNGRPDVNETVRVRFPLTNEGTQSTGDLGLSVVGPEEVTFFEQGLSGPVEADGAGFVELVFGMAGACGDRVALALTISNEDGVLGEATPDFQLGEILSPFPVNERFDQVRELPAGWESGELGGGQEWEIVSSRFDSPLKSVFSAGSRMSGEARLLSPSFQLGVNGGILSFRHLYRMEDEFDGGVLEVSREGGEWVDLLTGYGLQVEGGYDRTIREGFGSPLAGRAAWSGNSGLFRSTSVWLPARWAGESLRFRWRFGHDGSGLSEGWWVDTVQVEMEVDDCPEHQAVIRLRRHGEELDENRPGEGVRVILETALPLLGSLTIPLEWAGSAGEEDFTGEFLVTLPAGEIAVEIPVGVRVDDLAEGPETLVVAVPAAGAGFVAGPESEVTIAIRDRVDFGGWAREFLGEEVDPTGDRDGDGLSELGEYLLGTDPQDARSGAGFDLRVDGERLLIPTGPLPQRDDAVLGAELSSDLVTWEFVELTATEAGLVVVPAAAQPFLRLTFHLRDSEGRKNHQVPFTR